MGLFWVGLILVIVGRAYGLRFCKIVFNQSAKFEIFAVQFRFRAEPAERSIFGAGGDTMLKLCSRKGRADEV